MPLKQRPKRLWNPRFLLSGKLKISVLTFPPVNPEIVSRVVLVVMAALIYCTNPRLATGAPSHSSDDRSLFVGDPNLTNDLTPWDHIQIGGSKENVSEKRNGSGGAGSVSVVPDPLGSEGKVYKLTVAPTSGFAALSAAADRVDLWNNARPYMGQAGQETWEHFRILFRSNGDSYKPAPGNWNWLVQHHNDNGYQPFLNRGDIRPERPELAWGVDTRSKLPGGRQGEQLFMVIRGGDDRHSDELESWVYPDSALRYDHWYDMLVHIIWSDQRGAVEWWLDGRLICSQQTATLWRRPNGATDHVNFEFSNYRVHAAWSSTVYFSKVKIGSSREAVSF